MRVLFITANRIGDAILSTGLLQHLVMAYPAARFTVACGPLCTELFTALPRLDAVIALPKQSWNRHWWHLWRRCAPISWDIIVDLRDSVVGRLLRHGALYSYRPRPHLHKVLVNAAVMGLSPPPAPTLWVAPAEHATATTLLAGPGPILALGPTANWPAKQWPAASFAVLAQQLLATPPFQGGRVLVLGAAQERDQMTELLRAIPDSQRIELIGASLALAAACLQRATLYIGNDSGLMHLAAAAGIPTVGLFGPGDASVYGPYGPHTAVARTPEPAVELLRRLPQGSNQPVPSLMGSLQPDVVKQTALDLLKNCQ